SPAWDESVFGPIDSKAAARGERIYQEVCESCHARPWTSPFDPQTLEEQDEEAFERMFVKEEVNGRTNYLWKVTTVPYRDVGTDPAFMSNLLERWAGGGKVPRLVAMFDDAVRAQIRAKLTFFGIEPPDFAVDAGFSLALAKEYSAGIRRRNPETD